MSRQKSKGVRNKGGGKKVQVIGPALSNQTLAADVAEGFNVVLGNPSATERKLPAKLERLCDRFAKQAFSFVSEFARNSGLPQQKADEVTGFVLMRCSEVIAEARMAAYNAQQLEHHK